MVVSANTFITTVETDARKNSARGSP